MAVYQVEREKRNHRRLTANPTVIITKVNVMIEIPLTQNQMTIIDDIDSDLLDYRWSARQAHPDKPKGRYYAMRNSTASTGKRHVVLLHRVILTRKMGRELLQTEEVDHIDNNPLNNTRDNLRVAIGWQNKANSTVNRNNKLGVKGVSRSGNRFVARISIAHTQIYLGTFDSIEQAHEAYCNAAKHYFGEFARGQ